LKRSSQKGGEKRFRALQTDKDAPFGAARFNRARRTRTARTCGDATATNMTICTSSFIRTMTVGPGISPDLLTPHVRFPIRWDMHDAGARGLAG
jgi:hypothetical protein